MKILIVSKVYYPEFFSVNQVAEKFVKDGHEVTVITSIPNIGFNENLPEYEGRTFEIVNGVRVYRLKCVPRKNKGKLNIIRNYLSFWSKSKRFIKHFKDDFDVVLSFVISPVISMAAANIYAKKHNVPHINFCEDLWPESTVAVGSIKKGSLFYKILFKWSRDLYQKVDKIIVSSPSFIDYFKNVLNLPDKDYVYINQPILKGEKFLPAIKYESKKNIVYAGNIGTLQLIDKLIEAVKLCKDKDFVLHLLGTGSQLNSVLAKIKEEGLENRIIYHGKFPIEEVETYFRNADALVVILKENGPVGKTIPNKAIQYMSYERPIIGIIKGDGRDLLAKAKGSIFADEDAQSIANAFDKLCSLSEKEKSILGHNNLEYYSNHLTNDRLIQLLEDEVTSYKK